MARIEDKNMAPIASDVEGAAARAYYTDPARQAELAKQTEQLNAWRQQSDAGFEQMQQPAVGADDMGAKERETKALYSDGQPTGVEQAQAIDAEPVDPMYSRGFQDFALANQKPKQVQRGRGPARYSYDWVPPEWREDIVPKANGAYYQPNYLQRLDAFVTERPDLAPQIGKLHQDYRKWADTAQGAELEASRLDNVAEAERVMGAAGVLDQEGEGFKKLRAGIEQGVVDQKMALQKKNEYLVQWDNLVRQKVADYEAAAEKAKEFEFDAYGGIGGRIFAALAIGLGGAGQAMSGGGPNTGLEIVNSLVQNRLNEQKLQYEKLKGNVSDKANIVSYWMKHFNDMDMALAASAKSLYEQAAMQLEGIDVGNRAGNAAARKEALLAGLGTHMQAAEKHMYARIRAGADRAAAARMTVPKAPAGKQRRFLNLDQFNKMQQNYSRVLGGYYPEGAKLDQKFEVMRQADQILERMQVEASTMNPYDWGGPTDTEKWKRFKQLEANLHNQARTGAAIGASPGHEAMDKHLQEVAGRMFGEYGKADFALRNPVEMIQQTRDMLQSSIEQSQRHYAPSIAHGSPPRINMEPGATSKEFGFIDYEGPSERQYRFGDQQAEDSSSRIPDDAVGSFQRK